MLNADHRIPIAHDPLSDSLFGEYARMVLLGTSACSAAFWAIRLNSDPLAMLLTIGNILVLAALGTLRFAGFVRLVLLTMGAGCVVATVGTSDVSDAWFGPVPFFSPSALIACLAVLMGRDVIVLAKSSRAGISLRMIGGVVLIGFLVFYMIVLPSISSFLVQFQERPSSYTIEELTAFESLRIRSAEFAVFAFFTFFGACIGSFLNVVASSVPKGESIALRSSACPQCGTLIRRIDNLPIFSYLNLGGRCRECDASIPVRYLVVELIAAGIVAALFLVELITGAANVPEFTHYHYAGILWIILYTKWEVMGIFLYHVALMNSLLTLALIERDRQRCPRWLGWLMVVVFASLPIAINSLQPVAFDSQIPIEMSQKLPGWLRRFVTCLIGGVFGYLLAVSLQRMKLTGKSKLLPLGITLVGIALGWQATLTIGVFWTMATGLSQLSTRPMITPRKLVRSFGATAMLLVAAMVHQPLWKWLAEYW